MKEISLVIVLIASASSYHGNFGFRLKENYEFNSPVSKSVDSGEDIDPDLGSHGYLPPGSQHGERYRPYKPHGEEGWGYHKPPHEDYPPHYHPPWVPTPPKKPTWSGYEPTQPSINNYVQDCEAACPVGDYKPVCGSNNKAYQNIEQLECARRCGIDVQLSSPISCSLPEDQTNSNNFATCVSNCIVTSEYNPVCGTDDVTYANIGRFECAKNCGKDVEISRKSLCSVPPGPDNPDLRSTTETPKNNENGNNDNINGENTNVDDNENGNPDNKDGKCNTSRKTPPMAEVLACMQRCPITLEVNEVCGSDGVTYSNPGKMLCAQFCGVDVRVEKFSTCSGEVNPKPPPACPCSCTSSTDNPPTIEECLRRCPVSQELRPVCGSDGVTYINLESLQCKMRCGVDVSVQKLSACGEASTNPPTGPTPSGDNHTDKTEPTVTNPTPSDPVESCIGKCPVSQAFKPVCGTDGQTYGSLARLQCAKGCGVKVDVKRMSACYSTGPDSGITIAPDILASLFPEDFKPTTPKDSEETFNLDERYGDNKNKTL